ncbi:MAG: pantoate--beta-alanine ligase [Saprospiraceae bacterium]
MIVIIESAHDMQEFVNRIKKENKTIGFVPTMGALHKGHVKLVRESKKLADFTIVSIFVNPTQFNNKADLEKYPRQLLKDLELLFPPKVDVVFAPTQEEMYPNGLDHGNEWDLGGIDQPMEGQFRPGHFKGVAQVVKRLLDIVTPDFLFMGLKDFQQVAVVSHLIKSNNIPTQLISVPTLRSKSGLALSSRNARLSTEGLAKASMIYKALMSIKRNIDKKPLDILVKKALEKLDANGFKTEYLQVVDGHTLKQVNHLDMTDYAVVCIATWLEDVRLIDNIILKDS